jgi:hypothetical protein
MMFERYTEKARRAIFFSRYEASLYGSREIDTEHLLLGLFREDKVLFRWVPKTNAAALRQAVDQHLEKRPVISTATDLPLSASARKALKHAAHEAERLAHPHIGPEHLLLGLLDIEDTFSAKLLRNRGADAAQIREYYAQQSDVSRPLTFQRGSYKNLGFRTLSKETVEIHGARWNLDYLRDVVNLCRSHNWHWHKAQWSPRDVAIDRKTGRVSFDLSLANDSANFEIVKGGWKKDHCFVCRWELCQSDDAEHATGYTNGHDWVCTECYTKFFDRPDFFIPAYSDIT